MSAEDNTSDKHEKARELTEQALDKLIEGDDQAAQGLVDEAKKLDPTAVQEVIDDLDEDAADRGEATSGNDKSATR